MKDIVVSLVDEVRKELENDILPFWMTRMVDNVDGGFYGRITGDDVLCPEASKGAILNARILWTFSSAYRILKNDSYLKMASRAKDYLIAKFYDEQYGGIFWELDFMGNPADTKKQIYAIGFAIYGLSEYVRATGDKEALEYAVKLFDVIEKYSFDSVRGGYFEAFTREWEPIEDMRLSDKDENESKTMNTHLHVLEAYTNLYRVWKNELLKKRLAHLIDVFLHKILDNDTKHLNLFFDDNWINTKHLNLFFDDNWINKYHIMSYGHDIEASWLIHEAAIVLGDQSLLVEVEDMVPEIAKAADEGLNDDGSMIYERFVDKDTIDRELHWWVQAENVVGHVNLYQHYADSKALETYISIMLIVRLLKRLRTVGNLLRTNS